MPRGDVLLAGNVRKSEGNQKGQLWVVLLLQPNGKVLAQGMPVGASDEGVVARDDVECVAVRLLDQLAHYEAVVVHA